MIRTVLLVAAIVSLAEGAALVRFINTVPTRSTDQSQGNLAGYLGTNGTPAKTLSNDASVITGRSDRVGLQYFSQNSGTVAAPTLVWTTIVNSPAETGVATSPYAWFQAMPALRGYHTIRTGAADEAAAVDQPFGSRANNAANLNLSPAVYDNYDQSRLRADGVGLYLSFAAGSYRMQAYAAISDSDATRLTAIARPFTDSSVQLTFEDNKVYTLIAYGSGKYGETTPLNGNTVRLTLFEESMAPVTFGMASVRFFNAFATTTTNVAVDVYSGTGISDAARIASSIPVGGLSSYIDVTPGVQKEFPVAQTGSTSTYLASSTAVQRDVRAGSRTTIICGINNEQSGAGFCRGIPSRVVAYVRFINDLTGQDSLVQGAFGAQKLSQTRLTLWASYEVPRPEIVVEGSQVQGTQVVTGNPLTQEGLYPVIVNVAPGTVTGYGEVFVPVFIMDYAVRREIVYNPSGLTTPTATTNDLSYPATTNAYIFAPIYKRVHFVLKTDGYATLSARQGTDAAGDIYEWPTVGTSQTMKGVSTVGLPPNIGNQNGALAVTTDEYVEPGEYYSVIATTAALAAAAPVYAYQRSDIFSVFYRRDRSVDSISGGIQSGKGILALVPFATQNWATSAFSLQQGTTTTTPTMATVGVTTATAATAGPTTYPSSIPNEIQLNTGSYTYSAAATTACETTIPTSPSGITIADGQIYDLFVLNTFGCNVNGPSVSRLNVIVQQRGAVASANAPATSRRHAVPMAL